MAINEKTQKEEIQEIIKHIIFSAPDRFLKESMANIFIYLAFHTFAHFIFKYFLQSAVALSELILKCTIFKFYPPL